MAEWAIRLDRGFTRKNVRFASQANTRIGAYGESRPSVDSPFQLRLRLP